MSNLKWRSSLRFKSALFLTVLLLGALLLLCLLVLGAVRQNQKAQLEDELASQVKGINLFLQERAQMTEKPLNLKEHAQQLIQRASGNRAIQAAIYNQSGTLLITNALEKEGSERTKENETGLRAALSEKIAYTFSEHQVIYFAPLYEGERVIGAVSLNYDYSAYEQFYFKLKNMMFVIGAFVFLITLMLAGFYFGRLSQGIAVLGRAVKQVEKGNYHQLEALERKDELGELSRGIRNMAQTIDSGIEDLKHEQERQRMFFGRITHEFKTPLSVVNAYNDLAEMYADDAQLITDAHTQIKKEVARLNQMIENALQLSKLERKDFELSWAEVALKPLLENCIKRLQVKSDKYEICWETHLEDVWVRGDYEILEQVFMNLMDNAIKYNIEKGCIWVVCNVTGVCIENTGHGLSDEVKRRLFEPYSVDDQNNLTDIRGTGLGLGLVQHLMSMHHGQLDVEEATPTHQWQGLKGCCVTAKFEGLIRYNLDTNPMQK